MSSERALKRQNLPLLIAVLSADAVVLFLALNNFEVPENASWRMAVSRAIVSLLVPPAALLLAGILPPAIKDVLVFWRLSDVLPGHRAFSDATLSDPRIDVQKLTKNIASPIPASPRDQNSLWYRLFKKIENDAAIDQTNRSFLLHREIAAVSCIVCLAGAACWLLIAAWRPVAGWVVVLFLAQYIVSAVNSANYGRRLVTSVLAAHSVKRRK